jgi:hypothetical protein
MNITLCSAFRDSAGYAGRYLEAVGRLAGELHMRGDDLYCVWGEGDSRDNTRAMLEDALSERDTLLDVSHGGPKYGSVVHPERFRQLANIWNDIFDAIYDPGPNFENIKRSPDAVIFLESDLIWEPATLIALIDHLADYPAIAPMVYLRRQGYGQNAFYDRWAARMNGQQFALYPPYCAGWPYAEPFRVDSMGTCLAMRGEYASQTVWSEENLIVGICMQIEMLAGSIWIDPNLEVYHP